MKIIVDDLSGPEIARLLSEHLQSMIAITPEGSVHALDLEALRRPDITLWSAWKDRELVGCGALKELDRAHAEIKSMRTARAHLRKGVASQILAHIVTEAKGRGYRRLSLETGASEPFRPAQRLYQKFGFKPCGPFIGYIDDPNSVFMTLEISDSKFQIRDPSPT